MNKQITDVLFKIIKNNDHVINTIKEISYVYNDEKKSKIIISEWLKEYYSENIPKNIDDSWKDIIINSLEIVDWIFLAEFYLTKIKIRNDEDIIQT
jgi:hypothetical protein